MNHQNQSTTVGQILAEALQPVVDKLRVAFSTVGNALKSLLKTANDFSRLKTLLARKKAHLLERALVIEEPRRDREPRSKVFPGGVWFGRPTMNRHAWRWVPRQM